MPLIILYFVKWLWLVVAQVLWERKEYSLRFQWDMENYEDSEQVRPEFEIKAETFRWVTQSELNFKN